MEKVSGISILHYLLTMEEGWVQRYIVMEFIIALKCNSEILHGDGFAVMCCEIVLIFFRYAGM
ncbi:hypothetical protein D6445_11510 [Salmonella enterica subsp. enterica serovar Infantis]|nr:hypothetical protein [Salmonella enterica subsp. enterica serovar Infantis]